MAHLEVKPKSGSRWWLWLIIIIIIIVAAAFCYQQYYYGGTIANASDNGKPSVLDPAAMARIN
ncbi:MAG: hypothetical protein ACXVB0_19545 [Mucilaginibacter sp.]